ncbi:MAG: peptidyl-prolyl cis-trans isomerase [Deltaproteobacteria bacterium]|nr:peptidyl-prolyl cis-trans isomerase [Deltaproteobacteria bacterium]
MIHGLKIKGEFNVIVWMEMAITHRHVVHQVVALCCLVLCGCSGGTDQALQTREVIRVDDLVLTLRQFNDFFEPVRMGYLGEAAPDDEGLRAARARFLLEQLDEMVILRRAQELGLGVTPEELEAGLNEFKRDYDENSLHDMFMRQAISPETWKERTRRQLLVQKVVDRDLGATMVVSPEEIEQYYNAHYRQVPQTEAARVQQVLVADKLLADKLLKRLAQGEDFAELARRYSTAPEADRGGDMGYIARGELPESLESPIFDLTPGAVSRVVHSPYGYHIFKVIEKRPAGIPGLEGCVDKIREQVKKAKIEAAYGPWLAKLRVRYHVTVNKEII